MKRNIRFFFLAVMAIQMAACKNDTASTNPDAETAVQDTASAQRETHPETAASATVSQITALAADKMTLANGETVSLPAASDKTTTTIFFARHAETIEGKTSLAPEGQIRAGILATLFQATGLASVWASGNASLQTGLQPARANEAEMNIYKPEDGETFLKNLLYNYAGKKVLVFGTADEINGLLDLLSGEKTYAHIGPGEYNNLYVAFARKIKDADVEQFKY